MVFKKVSGLQEFNPEERAQIEIALGERIPSSVPTARLTNYIQRLEQAAANDPSNWLYQYWLGDFYQRAKRYVESKHTLDRALEHAPDDPRALYMAASIYRTLTYAYMTAPEIAPLIPYARQQMNMMGMDDSNFDPDASKAALDDLGISVRDAFVRAIDLYERARKHPLQGMDRRVVDETLQTVRAEFQNLPRGM